MNYQEILKSIQECRTGTQGEEIDPLLSQFETLMTIHIDEPQAKSFEEMVENHHQMKECFQGLKTEFAEFCEDTGVCVQEMQAEFNDSRNFSQETWEELQNLNRKYGIDEIESVKPKRRKMMKRRLKRWASV